MDTKLFPGIQSFCAAIGRWSCYAFCILKIAEKYTGANYDPLSEIIIAINKGFIKYNWNNANDPDNMFVKEPAAWLMMLTGRPWTVRKSYDWPEMRRYTVEVWNNAHFRLPDWDSLQDSVSVATGKITSWRVFEPI